MMLGFVIFDKRSIFAILFFTLLLSSGVFFAQSSPPAHICGNGIVEQPQEQCEIHSDCPFGFYCNPGCQCVQDNSVCGDGKITGREQCDPADSKIICKSGQLCDPLSCQCVSSLPVCGDGFLDAGEECDKEQNLNCGAYVCSQSCTCKTSCLTNADCKAGYSCLNNQCSPTAEQIAFGPQCGDGFLDAGEECDINTNNCAPGYTCSQNCTCESIRDFNPYTFTSSCGNGVLDQGEECDSDADCQVGQRCFSCSCVSVNEVARANPPYCGNGIIDEENEQCEYTNQCADAFICESCQCVSAPRLFGNAVQIAISPIILIGLFAAVVISAIAYMLAEFTNSIQLHVWAKSEFREVFASAALIIATIIAIAGIETFASAITGSPDMTSAAISHIDYFIQNSRNSINYLAEVNFYISKISSFSYSLSTPLIPFYSNKFISRSPSAGLSILTSSILQALDNLSKIIYAFSIQKMLLYFFSSTIPTLLLPAAFALRTFPLTRRVGTTLIAVCIGAYLWFPASIVFASWAYTQTNLDLNSIKNATDFDPGSPPAQSLVCSSTFALFVLPGEDFYEWLICSILLSNPATAGGFFSCANIVKLTYLAIVQGFPLPFGPALYNYAAISQSELISDYYSPLESVLHLISGFYTNALISILLTVFITVVMTKGTSEVLGGDTRIIGLYRLI
ncbi:MAG: hypothetical protein QXG33_00835 [Candidatus Anstonellales archaeon]